MARMEEEYLDVLQSIEFAIVSTHREHPDMTDYAVMQALEALIDRYKGEKAGRPPRDFRLSEVECLLEDAVRSKCEWRLGRGGLEGGSPTAKDAAMEPKSMDEIILCLKRVLKSVQKWNKEGGRQGYLTFIGHYIK